jgi:hypothetical protein
MEENIIFSLFFLELGKTWYYLSRNSIPKVQSQYGREGEMKGQVLLSWMVPRKPPRRLMFHFCKQPCTLLPFTLSLPVLHHKHGEEEYVGEF